MAGFTALTEKIDPEVVTDVMNEVFAALGAEVEAVGGHVDKVVGDELMALFGAPVAHEDDALRAVRAAAGMQRAMQARQEMLRRAFGQAPRLRIGIHSGQVVWGVVGPPGGRGGFGSRRRWPARSGERTSAKRGSLSSSKARPSRSRSTR